MAFPEQLEEYKQNNRIGVHANGVGPDELVFDNWTPLSFKRALGNRKSGGISWLAPTWVGKHSRRLQAYKVLQGYIDNAARFFLQQLDQETIDAHREYGDCALLRDQILAALLGDGQEIVTDGAEDFDPSLEEEQEPDAETEEGAEGEEAVQEPEVEENTEESRQAFQLQEWLREWANRERFRMKMLETERNAVGLGDGLYSLGWSGSKGRVRLRCWDPGFYFPVLDTGNDDDFPPTLHVAWEEEHPEFDKAAQGQTIIRRITWRMTRVDSYTPRYPDAEPTEWTCLMSDGWWEWDSQGTRTVEDLALDEATWLPYDEEDESGESVWHDIDLECDFIPVYHMPNGVAVLNHFGKSSLATVLQILDDLANTDTDLQSAGTTAGNPILAVMGAGIDTKNPPRYKPGTVYGLPEKGDMKWVDSAGALDALLKYLEALLDRLSTNSRLPAALLGRIKPSEVEAGVIMSLSFGPLKSMIEEMRLVRDEKYPLLLKHAWRLAHINGQEDVPGTWVESRVQFGSYMPNDLNAVILAVVGLLDKKAISLETALLMLIEAGVEIEDVVEEIRRIQARDFEGANRLLEATGDPALVFEYLDRTPSSPDLVAPPPTPTVGAEPAQPGGAPGNGAIQPIPRTPPTPPVTPV